MKLTPSEYQEMQYLLGKSQYSGGYLGSNEEARLRYLISKEQQVPANITLDDLIKLGIILVGLYVLLEALSKK